VSKKSLHRLLRDEVLDEARTLYAALSAAARRDQRLDRANRRVTTGRTSADLEVDRDRASRLDSSHDVEMRKLLRVDLLIV
jgi:hypothetical protein